MKKRLTLLLAGVLMTSALFGCGGGSSDSGSADSESGDAKQESDAGTDEGTAAKGDISIGFTSDYLSDFMSYVVEGVQAACDENGVKVSIQDAEFDTSKQLQQVENFINSGVDAVVIKPVDAEACGPISDACKDAGVPLIAVNSNMTASCDVYVGSDHTYSGELQGEYVAEQLTDGGNVAILVGDLTVQASTERTEGAKSKLAEGNNIEVVSEQEAHWMRDEAMAKMENWISSGEDLKAVIANNDEMAIGAAMVCEENGIDDIIICGIDASEDALNLLKDGKIAMTVYQNGYEQGYQGVLAAIKLANGETVEEYVDVPYEKILQDQAEEYLEKISK